jgi:putative glutamine amidotransferase
MKPIIGIINRKEILPSKNKIQYIYKDIVDKIKKSGGIPIGITPEKEIIKIIDGIILQGGDTYEQEEIDFIKELHTKNIPVLGICQGMQIMALATCGEIYKIENHNTKTTHKIIIEKNTKLQEILKTNIIEVNSRHNYAIKNTTLKINAQTEKNEIEGIEDPTKKFFIGLEWHPESMNNEDSKKIFDYFIKIMKEG